MTTETPPASTTVPRPRDCRACSGTGLRSKELATLAAGRAAVLDSELRARIQAAVEAHNAEWKSHVPSLCGMAVADAVLGKRAAAHPAEAEERP